MGRRHFKPAQTIHVLCEAEINLTGGKTAGEACRELGISEQEVPGVAIGGQIGPLLQGRVKQRTMERSIGLLFVFLAVAMMTVALRKSGIL